MPAPESRGLSLRGALIALCLAALGCSEAQGQPRPPARHDAGVAHHDAAVSRRDASAPRRDAAAPLVLLPPTHGRIDPHVAQRTLDTRATQVRDCYGQRLAHDPTLRGEVTVRLRVEADGHVSQTSASADDDMRVVVGCIEAALRPLVFPAPTGGAATVTVPYFFRPGD